MANLAALSMSVECRINGSIEVANDFSGGANPKQSIDISKIVELAVGSGADLANQMWLDQRTLAASGTENIDVQAGGLTNAFGQAIAFTKIKALYIHNRSTTGDLIIGGHATNAWASMFGDATDKVIVRRNGLLLNVCSDATGWAVAAGDLLTVLNQDGSNALTYDIAIIGESL